MNKIEAIRRANLQHLVWTEAEGNATKFASKYGMHQSHVNRYAAEHCESSKPMGNLAARNFERRIGLEQGALDRLLPGAKLGNDNTDAVRTVLSDPELIAQVIGRAIVVIPDHQMEMFEALLRMIRANPADETSTGFLSSLIRNATPQPVQQQPPALSAPEVVKALPART